MRMYKAGYKCICFVYTDLFLNWKRKDMTASGRHPDVTMFVAATEAFGPALDPSPCHALEHARALGRVLGRPATHPPRLGDQGSPGSSAAADGRGG